MRSSLAACLQRFSSRPVIPPKRNSRHPKALLSLCIESFVHPMVSLRSRAMRVWHCSAGFYIPGRNSILGAVIGRSELQYVGSSYDEFRKGLVGAGISPSLADDLVEMSTALNAGRFQSVVRRNSSNTTPATLEQRACDDFNHKTEQGRYGAADDHGSCVALNLTNHEELRSPA